MARIEPPSFVAVIGKPTLYETPDGAVLVSVRAESITVVERDVRDQWVLDTARATLDRLEEWGKTPDSERAQKDYPGMEPGTFRRMVYDALAQLKI
jgi:RPA family protein